MGLFKRSDRRSRKSAPEQVSSAQPAYAAPVRAADLTVGDYANGIPNIKLGSMFVSFLRQLLWLIPLLVIGWGVAWVMTADFKRTYTGEGTLLVQLGDEYVYQPIAGSDAQSSLLQTPDTIALNEVALIKNPEVMDRVIQSIIDSPGGLMAFDERIAKKMGGHSEGSMDYKLAYMELRKTMDSSFHVAARPRSSIIDLSFKHEDPQLAVSTLNDFIDAYMDYRRQVFVDGASVLVTQRREDAAGQLKANEQRMAAFLARHQISDFESEQKGASKRTEDLRASLNTLRARIVETERSLAIVEDQLRQTPASIDLYIDDRASNRIAQAELELKQLLAKYLPTADPVRQKQQEIEQLKSLQQSNGGRATGGRRVGVNTVHQDLTRSRNTLQATADSLREREITMQRQLESVDGKLRRMTSLGPAYNDLLREQETLNTRLKTYLNKEQEALINQQQAEAAAENVRVLSAATYPIKGRNMRLMAFAGAALAWAFTLFMLALFRVFSDPRLYATPAMSAAAEPMPRQAYQPYEPNPEPKGQMQLSPLDARLQRYEAAPQPRQTATDPYAPQPYQPAAHYQPPQQHHEWDQHPQVYHQPHAQNPLAYPEAPPSGYGYDGQDETSDNPYLSRGRSAASFR